MSYFKLGITWAFNGASVHFSAATNRWNQIFALHDHTESSEHHLWFASVLESFLIIKRLIGQINDDPINKFTFKVH